MGLAIFDRSCSERDFVLVEDWAVGAILRRKIYGPEQHYERRNGRCKDAN